MESLTTQSLSRACRIFMDFAYPAGAASIPASKLPYYDMVGGGALDDYVPPATVALGVCKELTRRADVIQGYEFRLGSAVYPHLKLHVQRVINRDRAIWVYSVDTHDGFLAATKHMNAQEADEWKRMQDDNRRLKHDIDEALGRAGFMTPNNLLQLELTTPS